MEDYRMVNKLKKIINDFFNFLLNLLNSFLGSFSQIQLRETSLKNYKGNIKSEINDIDEKKEDGAETEDHELVLVEMNTNEDGDENEILPLEVMIEDSNWYSYPIVYEINLPEPSFRCINIDKINLLNEEVLVNGK